MEENNEKMNDVTLEELKKAAYEGAKEGAKETSTVIKVKSASIVKDIAIKAVIIVLVIALVPLAFSKWNPFASLANVFDSEKDVEGYDLTLHNNGILGYTAADFEEAILGDSSQLKKIEVYSQEVSDLCQVTQTGLFNLKIFSKTKFYTYHGTATYTIDISSLTSNNITYDEQNNKVILTIPHAELSDLNVPFEDMEIGDIQKGILAIGDLELSEEDQQELIQQAKEEMKQKLIADDVVTTADNVGKMVIWELYQPLVSNVGSGVTLEIQFEEN